MGCNKLCDWWCMQPPLAVFLLTLVACAVTLVSISIYVDVHRDNLPDPNVRDWNTFFSSFSRVELCIPSIAANYSIAEADSVTEPLVQANISSVSALVTLSVEAVRPIESTPAVLDMLAHHTLYSNITEALLGIRVPLSRAADLMQIMIGLPESKSKKDSHKTKDSSSNKDIINVCITFTGPSRLLPNSIVTPESCSRENWPVRVVDALGVSGEPCAATDAVLPLLLQQQELLTPLLSQDDTVLIQLHIMYTTCALTVLILLLLCYAICRRAVHHARMPGHAAASSLEKVCLTE
ncbi:transmembrane protein 248 [Hyalella azteca]|uniref:Transmembrane protein 248 n=1 Tax=Hyalella azteca TaxID=294128 RepID=A0A8B7N2S3_HYAAZ|nr:transmembrane protein 248 [Hyalella azteca]